MADCTNAVPTSLGYHAVVKLLCVGSAAEVGAKFYLTSCGKVVEFDCVKLDASSLADPIDPQGIIVFDENANSISEYHRRLSGIYKNVPIILCVNEPGGKGLISQLKLGDGVCLPYFEISAKNNHSLEEPFLYLAKKLTGNNELCFVKALVPACADVQMPQLPKNNELHFVKSLVPACADVQMPQLPKEVPGPDPEPKKPAEHLPEAGRKALKLLGKTLACCFHLFIICATADCSC